VTDDDENLVGLLIIQVRKSEYESLMGPKVKKT